MVVPTQTTIDIIQKLNLADRQGERRLLIIGYSTFQHDRSYIGS